MMALTKKYTFDAIVDHNRYYALNIFWPSGKYEKCELYRDKTSSIFLCFEENTVYVIHVFQCQNKVFQNNYFSTT